ncbi:endolytic transglycosylase MltG [Corynebacterium renale]|uniref:endolytic transglycosylase MltG n=1 Tax=Corynebacterium renale TaxID=1724 RepID=UPI000E1C3478|nr:endolytic transglycosylase MltG [Corynebacterium renale]
MEPKFVKRRQRGLAVLIAAVVLIVAAIIYIGVKLTENNDYEGSGNGVTALVEVPEGSSLSELGPDLEEKNVVKTNEAFQSAAFMHPMASTLKPGFYKLQEEMSAESAVNALLSPSQYQIEMLDVHGGATLMDVKVVGGQTREGIYSQISRLSCAESESGDCLSVEELQRVAATTAPEQLGVPEWALEPVKSRGDDPKRIEGLIRPGQYIIDPNKSAQEILTDLITRSAEYYNSTNIVGRAQEIGLTPYELLTAASLVEREAPAGDFDKVARVILNRLDEPMRLEFDSTVNYGLDDVEVATTTEDRQRVTPWNTYASDGLPATPIAAPSDDAIAAMENPADGNWLFFVTVDKSGRTVFNDTFDAHQQSVQEALQSGILDSNR